jgi:peptide/nickel transport system substrate-binding protein
MSAVSLGSHLTLEPNPYWRGAKPAFKRIIIRTVENTAALEAQLLSGGVDMIAGELGLPLEQAVALDKRGDPRFRVVFKSGLAYEHLDVNLSSPVMADKRVRQALLYGLDRQGLNRQLFDGRQPVADSSVNPLDAVHADDTPPYSYDPAKAARLLDEAGWIRAGASRRNAKGESLSVELITTAGNRSRELLSQVIQGQWRQLGIDTRLKTEPARVFFGETVTKRRFPHLALFAWISSPESVPRSTLHSSQIPTTANNWTGQNYAGYADPRMDALLDAIELELDTAKRIELWRRLQHLYAEVLPALPLFFRADGTILPKQLQGIEPTGHQHPSTLWVENWRWQP